MSRPDLRSVATERLRSAVALAVEHRSFRVVARESGVSPMGLHRLIAGAEPQTRTRRKLEAWYLTGAGAQDPAGADVVTAAAALSVLASGLPLAARPAAIQQVVIVWKRMYEEAGVAVPRWVSSFVDP